VTKPLAPRRAVTLLAHGLLWLVCAVVAVHGATLHALDVGAPVVISGRVTDLEGQPLAGIAIMFEVSRRSLSFRRLERTEENLRRFSAVTDSRGSYTISWPWDPYFNSFVLTAGIAARTEGGQGATAPLEPLERLERREIETRKMKSGSVVENFALVDAARIGRVSGFSEKLTTDDERRVHAEMGNPDEVRVIEFPGKREATWWYFERGRAYRFESGTLAQVIHFEPVKRF
jgi:hypothetical protein